MPSAPRAEPSTVLSTDVLRLGKSTLDRVLALAQGTEDNGRLGAEVRLLFHSVAVSPAPQAPSEYETSPEQLFYRIAHLNRGQQYLLWVAAVTSAGRGNSSEKVTIEPAGKGERPGSDI